MRRRELWRSGWGGGLSCRLVVGGGLDINFGPGLVYVHKCVDYSYMINLTLDYIKGL